MQEESFHQINIKQTISSPEQPSEIKSGDNSSYEEQLAPVSISSMFRFATIFDIVLMIVGSFAAIAMGVALPAFALLWGNITDSFGGGGQGMVDAAFIAMLQFLYIGVASFVVAWIMFACWMITGQRQAISCRKAYLTSLLSQQIGWFDVINQSQLASKFSSDTFAFQGALGEKVSTLIMTISMFISGFVIAFVKGWLMALVLLSTIPALLIGGVLYIKAISKKDAQLQKDYAEAGGRAEQALSGIKTVKQLNGEEYQSNFYQQCLKKASKNLLKYAMYGGAGIGIIFFVMLASYSLGFWWGSVLIERKQPNAVSSTGFYKTGDVLVIFFSIVMAGFNLSQLSPALEKIAQGRAAAARIYSVLDRVPKIKNPVNGLKPQKIEGVIRFENVSFAYPKDRSRQIFKDMNIEFDCRNSGLVGQSGCGKSTVLQLVMRFYDPDQGRVTLDGNDIKSLDLQWLRDNIGYVGQQPVLFATSIRQNLLFGKGDATSQQIDNALKAAQAYDFVQNLEEKLDTYVGYGGGQLSGGQKQRIAIARAILKNPRILLLDQATSALDRRNERLIQDTLDKLTQGRTTITVAHRIKTIMHCNIIYVLDKGSVAEKGTFDTLPRFKGIKAQPDIEQKAQEVKKQTQVQEIKLQSLKPLKDKERQIFANKEQKEKKEQQELLLKYQSSIFGRLFSYTTSSWGNIFLFICGIIVAMGNGCIFPIFSIYLSSMLTALFSLEFNRTNSGRSEADYYAIVFLILAIASLIANFLQYTLFSLIGSDITNKLRVQVYEKILKMPVYWFDLPRNNAGSLSARLSTDSQIVNGLTTTFVAVTLQNITSLVAGLIIGFVFEWRTSLVALGLLPLMIITGAVQMAFNTGFSDKTDEAYKDSSNIIMEAMINIRTVNSFGYENIIANKYSEKLETPYNLAIKRGNLSGIMFGLSQLIMFVVFALIFYLGTLFIRDNPDVSVNNVFTAIYAILFSAMSVGNNSHFMPDMAAAKNAAANLFLILDSKDEGQIQTEEESKFIKTGISGKIDIQNISFKYENRKNELFKNFSLKIQDGHKVAFVGTSGCGKSTIIQLLLRFYPISEGQILINGVNIKDYDIHYLRSCFGVVSQEPVLFNGSFADNIRYNLKNIQDKDIVQAAIQANAISFIAGDEQLQQSSPLKKPDNKNKEDKIKVQIEMDEIGKDGTGFDRGVGVKGSHISGGQKQRVAIARAILRNPKILLLDEATSALDSVNEKKVQQSLDQIMKGHTSISIAHRLQTIRNSNQIYVFQSGKLAESGDYNSLMSRKGYFYNLERGTQFV